MPSARVLRIAITTLCLMMIGVSTVLAQEVTHVVQPGENLFRISLRYGVDVDALAAANGISNSWQIYSGQTLTIPGTGTPVEAVAETIPLPVENVAPLPAVPVEIEAPAAAVPVENTAPTTHVVSRGEHLASIARHYGMTPEDLARINSIVNPNLIYFGQELIIHPGTPQEVAAQPADAAAVTTTDTAAALPAEAAPAPAPTTYVVQPGDRLASIADQFGISWLVLAQANNIYNADFIQPGQELTIPGAVVAAADFGIVNLPAAPAATVATGRSIMVDLSDSRIYAYEDGVLVRNVLASTGLPATPTVIGNFSVYTKYGAQTMSGPGYYLPDVPYVMYFYSGYAIHGTYWHSNWGRPMSHGCVNLPTPEAEWFFNWASVGTPVHVQY